MLLAANCRSVVAGAVEDVDGVRQQVSDGFEGLDRALRAAGKIDEDALAAHGGDGAREDGCGSFFHAFAAHFFRDSRDDEVSYGNGGFGSVVAGTDTGTTGSENDVNAARVGDGAELFANARWIIGQAQSGGNFPAEAAAEGDDGGPGGVFAFAFGGGIADGEDGYAHGRKVFENL
jgi:hypothetical protein